VVDFIARVTADSGTFEAKQCLINLIENIWVYLIVHLW
jgi:hypothetical protein